MASKWMKSGKGSASSNKKPKKRDKKYLDKTQIPPAPTLFINRIIKKQDDPKPPAKNPAKIKDLKDLSDSDSGSHSLSFGGVDGYTSPQEVETPQLEKKAAMARNRKVSKLMAKKMWGKMSSIMVAKPEAGGAGKKD